MKLKRVAFEPMNQIHDNEAKILEELLDKIKRRKPLLKEYQKFLEDLKHHFLFEEELMKKYDFFAFIPHKMEHDKILSEIEELKNYLNDFEYLQSYFENRFLPWLYNHIETIDTVTAGFLNMIKKGEKNGI